MQPTSRLCQSRGKVGLVCLRAAVKEWQENGKLWNHLEKARNTVPGGLEWEPDQRVSPKAILYLLCDYSKTLSSSGSLVFFTCKMIILIMPTSKHYQEDERKYTFKSHCLSTRETLKKRFILIIWTLTKHLTGNTNRTEGITSQKSYKTFHWVFYIFWTPKTDGLTNCGFAVVPSCHMGTANVSHEEKE